MALLCFFLPFLPLFPSWEHSSTPVPEMHSTVLPLPHGPLSILWQRKGWGSCCSSAYPHMTLTAMQQRCPPCSYLLPALLAEVVAPIHAAPPAADSQHRLSLQHRDHSHQPALLLSRASSKALANQAHLCPTAVLLILFKEVTKII